jgi:fumarylacetoacetase
VAIGDAILDLARLRDARVLAGDAATALEAAAEVSLNRYMSLGGTAWSALRRAVSRLLAADDPQRHDHRRRGAGAAG